jgi:hypothetical protein
MEERAAIRHYPTVLHPARRLSIRAATGNHRPGSA